MSSLPSSFFIFGGIPTSVDLAPSLVFLCAFVAIIPLFVWRLASPSTRFGIILRPGLLILLRIATYGVRATQARGNYSVGLFIAEQIFFSIGFTLICEPLVALASASLFPLLDEAKHPTLHLLTKALRLMIIVAVICGVVAGSEIEKSFTSTSTAHLVKILRQVNYSIVVALVGIMFLASLYILYLIRQRSPAYQPSEVEIGLSPAAYLVCMSAILLIPAVYREVALAESDYKPPSFYVVFCLFEWAAVTLYGAAPIKRWFGACIEATKQTTSTVKPMS